LGRVEISNLLRFDLREAFDSIAWIIYPWLYFGFQFFVYGTLLSRLVVALPNYLYYYGAGLLILVSFNVATWNGRRFVESAHEGRLRYLLSLPMERNELFVEQVLLGVIVSASRVFPPLVLVLYLSNLFTPIALVLSLIVLSLVTIGIIGLMVALSVIAFKSFDIYSAIVAALSALLIRFSTMNYPIFAMNKSIASVSLLNPITYGSDLLRSSIGLDTSVLINPELALTIVVALSIGALFAGMFLISSVVEGVKSS
jgi:hypothetical protein